MTSKTEQETLTLLFEAAHQDDAPCPVDAQQMMSDAMTPSSAPSVGRKRHVLQWSLALGLVALSCLSIGIYVKEQQQDTHNAFAVAKEPAKAVDIQALSLDWEAPTDFLIEESFAISDPSDHDDQMTDILLEDYHDIY